MLENRPVPMKREKNAASQRPEKLFRPVYAEDGNPDPSEIKILRVDREKTIPNWLFALVILLMAAVFPLLIFLGLLGGGTA